MCCLNMISIFILHLGKYHQMHTMQPSLLFRDVSIAFMHTLPQTQLFTGKF